MAISAPHRYNALIAAALCLPASAGWAADMRGTLPAAPPVEYASPPPALSDTGLYLRGDLGYGFNRAGNIVYAPTSVAGERTLSQSLKGSGVVSVGVGYQLNAMLRGDITLEQRGQSNFRYLDRVENTSNPAAYYLNDVRGSLNLRVAMANAYMHMGTWNNISPFVGVGVGVAAANVRNVTNKGVGPGNNHPNARGIGDNADSTGLAFALHAGLSYRITGNWSAELGYRYLGLNTIKGGTMNCYNALTSTYDACGYRTVIKNFGAHDIKFGIRYLFASPGAAPVYAQPGYLSQPILSRKG
jgi:opacity protein-like surface antigen